MNYFLISYRLFEHEFYHAEVTDSALEGAKYQRGCFSLSTNMKEKEDGMRKMIEKERRSRPGSYTIIVYRGHNFRL